MIVLGFDTATSATAVGLRLTDGTTLQARDDPGPGERPGHATCLLPLATELLAQAGLGWGNIERIAVGVGPGRFTGLRIGVATARGLAQSLEVELAGVSSLRALAHMAESCDEGRDRGILAAIDARRGEAFAAAYRAPADGSSPDHSRVDRSRADRSRDAPRELTVPRALAPASLGQVLDGASAVTDEPVNRWLGVGDGAVLYRDALGSLGVDVPPEQSPLHRVSAEAICELAMSMPAQGAEAVLPDYRRRPDAEIASARTGAGAGEQAGASA
jgi:tRNA threonylcarbamoyladenosine biosynthesis protein TsaB